jgi:hypothetical protein
VPSQSKMYPAYRFSGGVNTVIARARGYLHGFEEFTTGSRKSGDSQNFD